MTTDHKLNTLTAFREILRVTIENSFNNGGIENIGLFEAIISSGYKDDLQASLKLEHSIFELIFEECNLDTCPAESLKWLFSNIQSFADRAKDAGLLDNTLAKYLSLSETIFTAQDNAVFNRACREGFYEMAELGEKILTAAEKEISVIYQGLRQACLGEHEDIMNVIIGDHKERLLQYVELSYLFKELCTENKDTALSLIIEKLGGDEIVNETNFAKAVKQSKKSTVDLLLKQADDTHRQKLFSAGFSQAVYDMTGMFDYLVEIADTESLLSFITARKEWLQEDDSDPDKEKAEKVVAALLIQADLENDRTKYQRVQSFMKEVGRKEELEVS